MSNHITTKNIKTAMEILLVLMEEYEKNGKEGFEIHDIRGQWIHVDDMINEWLDTPADTKI